MTTTFFKDLNKLKAQNTYRQLTDIQKISSTKGIIGSSSVIFFSSNDYLGLSDHPKIKESAIKATEKYGTSATASRLINGNYHLYQELEQKIADLKNKEAALIYPTGYMANLGLMSALTHKDDIVYMDRLSHASLYDGCKLSQAQLYRYTHQDILELERLTNQHKAKHHKAFGKRFIVTDGVFSMDGDIAPLVELQRIAKDHDCLLIVDDAHGTGVLGVDGKGSTAYSRTKADIDMGTFSKALGGLGGFIAADKELIDYLINKSRPFMFTTGLPPAVTAAALCALGVIKEESWRQKKVLDLTRFARKTLLDAGFSIPKGFTPIIPIMICSEEKAVYFSGSLLEKGIFIPAIRTPAVAKGKARLRMTLSAAHTEEELNQALNTLISVGNKLHLLPSAAGARPGGGD